ncbi:MAG: hypothetical protein ABI947_09495 [Chloroflexota bacterium]
MKHHNSTENKPKLTPVKVPWQISSAVPAVKLTVYAEARVVIEFAAIIWHEAKGAKQSVEDKTYDQFEERIIVTFEHAFWVRVHPTISDAEPIDYEKYDTSALGPLHINSKEAYTYLDEYRTKWLTSGICPDSGMYEVEGSDWIPSEDAFLKDGYKHYLLVGQELYYDIFGKKWQWSSEGTINGLSKNG